MEEEIEWFLPVCEVEEMLECRTREVFELARTGQLRFIQMPETRKIKVSRESAQSYAKKLAIS